MFPDMNAQEFEWLSKLAVRNACKLHNFKSHKYLQQQYKPVLLKGLVNKDFHRLIANGKYLEFYNNNKIIVH